MQMSKIKCVLSMSKLISISRSVYHYCFQHWGWNPGPHTCRLSTSELHSQPHPQFLTQESFVVLILFYTILCLSSLKLQANLPEDVKFSIFPYSQVKIIHILISHILHIQKFNLSQCINEATRKPGLLWAWCGKGHTVRWNKKGAKSRTVLSKRNNSI